MWYVLALALGGRTVREWQAAITPEEFRDWCEYYRRWPFDDFHRHHRPAALVAHAMGGGDETAFAARLEWLQPEGREVKRPRNPADAAIWRAAGWAG